MKLLHSIIVAVGHLLILSSSGQAQNNIYPWLSDSASVDNIAKRIATPDGCERIDVEPGSFEDWLRHLPLYDGRPSVYLYNDQKKGNQDAHYAVINIDAGDKDLQQCADAIIRLRAEYLFSSGNYDAIHFNFTSGDKASFRKWINGYRSRVNGSNVEWVKSADIDSSYNSFRKYLETVFMYAGSYSLSREMKKLNDIKRMKIGDVFIQGGFLGHAVIVVDMAVNKDDGSRIFLLAQSYMPAQQVHILKNPIERQFNPWYKVDFGDTLFTPDWIFQKEDLKHFR